jgi:hypothetical protein
MKGALKIVAVVAAYQVGQRLTIKALVASKGAAAVADSETTSRYEAYAGGAAAAILVAKLVKVI